MPNYTFACDQCDDYVDIKGSMHDPPQPMVCEGCGNMRYRIYNKRCAAPPSCWPQFSDAAGVGAHQVGEAYKKSLELGVPTEFTKDGRAIFTSREHRKRYCAAFGLYDRNAGYGDQARQSEVMSEGPKVPIFDFDGS